MNFEEWKTFSLEDLLEDLIDYRGKTPKKISSGIPLITAKVIKKGTIQTPDEFISEDDYDAWMVRGLPKVGDVVLTTEAPLGEVAQLTNSRVALAQRIVTLRAKEGKLDNTFLKYFFMSKIGQARLKERESGTTVTGIKQSELRLVKIDCPTVAVQQKIATILSSLDDKIDLNNHMNKVLEKMAQAIFKQWLVDFEFPNEGGQPYKSSGGAMEWCEELDKEIPTGWKAAKITELVDSISKTYKFPKDEVIFLNTSDVHEGEVLNTDYSKVSELPGQAKKSIQKNDILYSEIRPTNKRYAFIDFDAEDYVVSTKLMVLRTKNYIDPVLVYFYLTNHEVISYLQMIAESRSGTFPQITFQSLDSLRLVIGPEDKMTECAQIIRDIFHKIKHNKRQVNYLTRLRETLLPKLMSGEIDVLRER